MIKVLAALATMVSAGTLAAQERRDTLLPMFQLSLPDSMALTRIEQLVPGSDGSVYLLDALTDGALMFGPNGAFRGRIGRHGEGPGELLSPWRLGLLGRDTLWVVDARQPRISLYDAASGTSIDDLGPDKWTDGGAGGEPSRPFALLADHGVATVRWPRGAPVAEVRAHGVAWQRAEAGDALQLLLDVRARLLAVPVPAGGGGLQLRNPFSYSDMIAVGPGGRRVVVIRRPRPEGSPAFFVAERHDVLRGVVDTVEISYEPHPLEAAEVRAWAEGLGPVERMVELGVFPSRAAGVEAVLDALDPPRHHPPVENRGRGIVDEGVIVDPDGGMWFQLYDPSGRSNEWIVVSGEVGAGAVSRVTAPEGARLLAVSGDRVWAEVRDAFGVPSVQVLRIQGAGG